MVQASLYGWALTSSSRRALTATGVGDEDIRHAYEHPIRVFDLDEGFTMVIGANQAAIIFEIGLLTECWRPSSSTP